MKNTYKVKEGTITLYNAEEKPVHSASYKLEKGELVLNDGKSIIRYARIGEAG